MRTSPALASTSGPYASSGLDPANLFVGHIKLTKTVGAAAIMTRVSLVARVMVDSSGSARNRTTKTNLD